MPRTRRSPCSSNRDSLCHNALTCPSVPVLQLGCIKGSPGPRQLPFGPGKCLYPAGYGDDREGCGLGVPVSRRLSVYRHWLLGPSCARRGWASLTVGLPGQVPEPDGVSRSAWPRSGRVGRRDAYTSPRRPESSAAGRDDDRRGSAAGDPIFAAGTTRGSLSKRRSDSPAVTLVRNRCRAGSSWPVAMPSAGGRVRLARVIDG